MAPRKKRPPSEVNWLCNNSNITHLTFFDFFKSYSKRRAQSRFISITKHIENQDLKTKVINDYKEWRVTKEGNDYWSEREKINNNDADDNNITSSSSNNSIISITLIAANSSKNIKRFHEQGPLVITFEGN